MRQPAGDATTSPVRKEVDSADAVTPLRRPWHKWHRTFNRRRAETPVSVLDLAAVGERDPSDPKVIDVGDDSAIHVDRHNDETEDAVGARAASSSVRVGLVYVLVVIAALAALGGWSGYRAFATVQEQRQHAQFLEAGKQAAVKLTSINHADADGDVKRILESATGPFSEDFQKRSQPFVDMVKQVQSTTVGTVAEAGLEGVDGDKARVLVAMSVKTTLGAGGEQPPRLWRMRIEVQKIGHETKVSNVEFVP